MPLFSPLGLCEKEEKKKRREREKKSERRNIAVRI